MNSSASNRSPVLQMSFWTAPDAIHVHHGGEVEPWLVITACRNERPTRPGSIRHVVSLKWSSNTSLEAERREFWALDPSNIDSVSRASGATCWTCFQLADSRCSGPQHERAPRRHRSRDHRLHGRVRADRYGRDSSTSTAGRHWQSNSASGHCVHSACAFHARCISHERDARAARHST